MIEHLDFLIAYVTIITGVSLLITIFVQAVSWILALRGKNLQQGLKETFETVVSPADAVRIKGELEELTYAILAEGPLSHGVFTGVGKLQSDREKTVVSGDGEQAESNDGGAQGEKNGEGPSGIKKMAVDVWTAPVVGMGWNKRFLASAVRPEEVVARLEQLKRDADTLGGNVDNAVTRVGKAAGIILDAFPKDTKEADRVRVLIESVKTELAENDIDPASPVTSLIGQIETELIAKMAETRKSLESWIDSALDRVQQKFASEARFWAIFGAFLAAWCLQLDTFRIWDQLANDTDARKRLVATSDAMVQRAAKSLDVENPLSKEFHLQILEAMKVENETEKQFSKALETLTAGENVRDFASESERRRMLRNKIEGIEEVEETFPETFLEAFEKKRSELAGERLRGLLGDYEETVGMLSGAGFSLQPPALSGNNHLEKALCWLGFKVQTSSVDVFPFFGMLCTAALLTLGAPFWFNLLKTLGRLRPVLADTVREKKDP